MSFRHQVKGAGTGERAPIAWRFRSLAIAAAAGLIMSVPAPLFAQDHRADIAGDAADARNDAVFAMPNRSKPARPANLYSKAPRSEAHRSRSRRLPKGSATASAPKQGGHGQ